MRRIIDPSQYFSQKKIQEVDRDRFRPMLYSNLYIPSWVNGYSIGVEYIYNWFLSKFSKGFFKTIHIAEESALNDFRKYSVGNLIKRENPACLFEAQIQYEFDDNKLDLSYYRTESYLRRSKYETSFFKDPEKKIYIAYSMEVMLITFNIRNRFETKSEQIDDYNRIRKTFPFGLTQSKDIDMDIYIPYNLMRDVAKTAGFNVDVDGTIIDIDKFVKYLNMHSQMPILYKLRTVNGKREFFIRMNSLPIHLDLTNPIDANAGEQSGHMMTNYEVSMQINMRIPVPAFFMFYNEGYVKSDIIVQDNNTDINLYSVRIMDIPEVNYRGWPMNGHLNYLADENEKIVEKIDISEWFKPATKGIKIGINLNDIIKESLDHYVNPSTFIDIAVYTNDISKNKLNTKIDWENKVIILPKDTTDQYFYIAIYVDRSYVNDRIITITNANNSRYSESKNTNIEEEKQIRDLYEQNHTIEKKQ